MPDPSRSPAYEPPDDNRPASSAPTEDQLEREQPTVHALDYSPAVPGHDPYAALRFPAYRLFSIGWMIAVVGNQMTAAALGWEIFDRTKSQLHLGWLAGVQVIPLIVLALPAGVIADRFDRRRLIAVTAFLNALCSVGLAWCSYREGSLPWVYVCVIASATVLTIGRPARSALLPNIVPAAAFSNAVTWNSSFFQVSAMLGPALGGLLIAGSLRQFHSLALPYALDAVSAFTYAVMMFWIPRPAAAARPAVGGEREGGDSPPTLNYATAGASSGIADSQSPVQQLLAGIRFVYGTKIIFATLTLDLFAVLLGGSVYLLPVFAQHVLHSTPAEFGWLRAAEAIGAFVTALTLAHLPPMRKAGRSMLLAVAGFGVCAIVFGLSRNFWLSMAALVLLGAFDNISVVVRHTLVQILTPDAMRGRVNAVNNIFIGTSNELGGMESALTAAGFSALAVYYGASAEQAGVWGPTLSVAVGGVGTLLTVALVAWAFPQLRRFGPLQPHAPDPTLKGRGGSNTAEGTDQSDAAPERG